ncbi:putative phage tail protein [Acetobacter fallax]|uniref:DUF2313 domain-containing protein n=1 Tax=Acetobacter fallax TaxID=1737473 RepID=A0ABX0KA94_9PROT|nr:putative phage tail protein [Acetobacter fallax]NHO33339.1 DUF2313 domain-containing protein [Acetobacter fallax]NHO36960.1 DUF2313 domain-containing protein [Acetobacter fallax]
MSVLLDSADTVILDQNGDPLLDQGPRPPRTLDEIRTGILRDLLPPGWAWPHVAGSNLGSMVSGLGVPIEALDADIAALALEISPAQSTLLLSDYEVVLGADPCGTDPAGMALSARQAFDNARWIGSSGVSDAFFRRLSDAAGVTISIEEPEPPVCGEVVCGETVCGDIDLRFIWIVTLPNHETGLECPFRRNSPPDLTLVFDYAGNS